MKMSDKTAKLTKSEKDHIISEIEMVRVCIGKMASFIEQLTSPMEPDTIRGCTFVLNEACMTLEDASNRISKLGLNK